MAQRLEEALAAQDARLRQLRRDRLSDASVASGASPLWHASALADEPQERTWRDRLLASGAFGAHKLRLIRKVLRQQRVQHVARCESWARLSRQQAAVARVDLAQVRDFLRDQTGLVQIRFSVAPQEHVG